MGRGKRHLLRISLTVTNLEHFIKSGLFVIQDGQALLARSHGDNHFQIPGGKIEPDRKDIDALIRGVKEGLSVALVPESAVHLATFKAQAASHTNVLVQIGVYSGTFEGVPRAGSKIAELVRQSAEAPSLLCSDVMLLHILPYLTRYLSEQGCIS